MITVYPNYNLTRSGKYELHFYTNVRKLWTNGKYYLIPVRKIYSLNKGIGIKRRVDGFISALDDFYDSCYRVLISWDCMTKTSLDPKDGAVIAAVEDEDQQPEVQRLNETTLK